VYLNTYVITREYNNTSINKNETMKRVYVYLFMFMFYVITGFQPLWGVTHKSCRKLWLHVSWNKTVDAAHAHWRLPV